MEFYTIPFSWILEYCKFELTATYIRIGKRTVFQRKGLPMGNPISPGLAFSDRLLQKRTRLEHEANDEEYHILKISSRHTSDSSISGKHKRSRRTKENLTKNIRSDGHTKLEKSSYDHTSNVRMDLKVTKRDY